MKEPTLVIMDGLSPEDEAALVAELEYRAKKLEQTEAIDHFVHELLIALRVPQILDWLARILRRFK